MPLTLPSTPPTAIQSPALKLKDQDQQARGKVRQVALQGQADSQTESTKGGQEGVGRNPQFIEADKRTMAMRA